MFTQRTRDQLWKQMNRPLSDLRLAVIMLDGIDLHGRTNIVALGITTEGEKLALGLWDGSSENAAVAGALLSDLVDRGLDVEQGLLFVIDGSKGLRKAIRQVFGNDVPVQRCVQHKERNVLDHLPERDRQPVKARLRRAWKETDHDLALEQLNTLALELDRAHPGAAASLREGMEKTLTVTRLGITAKLKLTLQSTNPWESMISTVPVIHRNVKHWSSGEMCLRWTAAGMLEAESRFRKVQGYRGLAGLAVKIEHDLLRNRQPDTYTSTQETTPPPLCNDDTRESPSLKLPRRTGHPPVQPEALADRLACSGEQAPGADALAFPGIRGSVLARGDAPNRARTGRCFVVERTPCGARTDRSSDTQVRLATPAGAGDRHWPMSSGRATSCDCIRGVAIVRAGDGGVLLWRLMCRWL
jgi:hypothetical protein